MISCQPSPRCTDRTDVYINIGFYTLKNGIETDTLLTRPVIYGIGREDSVLTSGISSLDKIGLPPAPGQTSCLFVLNYGGQSDTLSFSYTPDLQFLSFECGFIEFYTDMEFTTTNHLIDSSAVTQPLVSNNDEENIRLYIF